MMKNLIIILLSSFLVSGISNYKDISTPVELDLHDQIGEDISPKDIHAHHENLERIFYRRIYMPIMRIPWLILSMM